MNKRLRAGEALASRAARRLMQSLSEPGARAVPSAIKDNMFVVLAPRDGGTVVRASVSAQVVEYPRSRGLVRWDDGPRLRQLRLTEDGRAHLRRLSAGAGVDGFRAQHSRIA